MSVRRHQLLAITVAASLSACGGSVSAPSSALVASATSVVAKQDTTPILRTNITLENRGESPAQLEYGACATRVVAYRSAARDAVPVWDSNGRRMWSTGQPIVCLAYGVATTLAPGASLSAPEFTLAVPLLEVLGDSLPDGHYYFRAGLGLSTPGPIAEIPAGDAELSVARPLLPATRRSFIMQWTAAPVTVVGGNVVARASGVVVNANGALIEVERNCPVLIRVYRDRTRRDEAPRSGAADWSQPVCVRATESATMYRGDSRTFESSVPVTDILGASLPSGRYYFAVLVKGDGMEMVLSAGELDLARGTALLLQHG